MKPGLAAGLVVLGLLAVAAGAMVATVRGVTGQVDQIGASVDAALDNATGALGIDQGTLDAARAATEDAAPAIAGGFLTRVVSLRGRLTGGSGQRRDPRRPDHVLPAQGRQSIPAVRRRTVRPGLSGRDRQLLRRLVRDAA